MYTLGTQGTGWTTGMRSGVVLYEAPDPLSLSCFLLSPKCLKSEISGASWYSRGREHAPAAALAGATRVDFTI